MSAGTKRTPNGSENTLTPELEREKVSEVKSLIGPLSGRLAIYCSDATITRYLKARNWNVKKATKMLKTSIKWRAEYKPEEICWDDIAREAETGKIYRSNYKDKYGRTVLVMRPRCQNSKSIRAQIKYLVYCMENAVVNLPEDQEQMIWLIDFHGFNMSNISVKVTKETAHVLQEHYPERLGVAVLYDAPKIFEPFWKVVKPFLEPKTAEKVKFVYSDNPNSKKILEDLFDMEKVESAFGGKDNSDFDIISYAERMREDDKKHSSFWSIESIGAPDPAPANISSLDPANSEPDSDVTDEQAAKYPPDDVNIEELSVDEPLEGTCGSSKDAKHVKTGDE